MSSRSSDIFYAKEKTPSSKESKSPNVSKVDAELKTSLERYKLSQKSQQETGCTNCWMAYQKTKGELVLHKKLEKERKKEDRSDSEKMNDMLREASSMKKRADTLKEQGKEKQSEGYEKKAESLMQSAAEIYENMGQDEKDDIDDEFRASIAHGQIPPSLLQKSEVSKMQNKIGKYEKLKVEVEKTIPYINNENQAKKLKNIISTIDQ